MDTTDTKVCRLKSISKRLRFIGKINIGLMSVLMVFIILYWVRFHIASKGLMNQIEHDLTPDPMPNMHWMTTTMLGLAIASFCLLLIWGPALVVCSFKIKRLKKDDHDT
jgi:hypothetical protein